MTPGNEKEPTGSVVKEENWVRTFLAQNITHKPGTQFMYNSVATYMCSAIVQKVTGRRCSTTSRRVCSRRSASAA
jgi:CubicO group peptidase (beta-lactamase class C family)